LIGGTTHTAETLACIIKDKAKMNEQQHVTINLDNIEKFSNEFLTNIKSNPFYNKNVFFTQGLRATKYIEFQIIGNLGGHANDYEFNTETDYYIIADNFINDLRTGKKDTQLQQLEKKINAKGKKHENLEILSETAFLKHIRKRCQEIGDNVTLDLINQVP